MPELLILRADCYRKTGETDKALTDIEKYLEIYPDNKAALSLAGKVEAISGDNLKALEYFSKNLKLHPNDPECYIDRANSYFVSKSWDLAINDYSMSLGSQTCRILMSGLIKVLLCSIQEKWKMPVTISENHSVWEIKG